MYLIDTCVLSEGVRPRPDPSVVTWFRYQDPARLFVSAITLGELHYGSARLADVAEQRKFNSWIADIERRFAGQIVVLDDLVARQWGYLRAAYPKAQTADAQLAATALVHGFAFVTRNVKHFRFDGLAVVNPWEA
ncbi:MAG: type II toxin-antitoxin system VapC family toxin [Rhizomicrobium sp.]